MTRYHSRVAKNRKTVVLAVIVATGLCLLLAYQAITSIVTGDYVMGENYMGQPVGPGLQLAVLATALVVGIVAVWQYFHPKPESQEKKKDKGKPFYGRWPYDVP